MFTGIVEELGRVAALDDLGTAVRLTVTGPLVTSDARVGDSIAVNGVCLTVVTCGEGAFTADVMKETLDRSTLGGLTVGSTVNLERAVTPSTRLGGHMVSGHVDGVGEVVGRVVDEHWETLRFRLPEGLGRYLVEKGSVAVDGVSLTVVSVADDEFTVSLIPTTLAMTTLGAAQPGSRVNLEVDVIAKYVEKLYADRLREGT